MSKGTTEFQVARDELKAKLDGFQKQTEKLELERNRLAALIEKAARSGRDNVRGFFVVEMKNEFFNISIRGFSFVCFAESQDSGNAKVAGVSNEGGSRCQDSVGVCFCFLFSTV